MAESQAPPISDESLAEARKLVGVWLNHHQRALVVTRDVIRQWAHSMGDENPLFCNEDYAKGTRWGEVIAPVGFLMHAHSTHIGPGLRGIQWIYGGTEWQLFRPVRAGDIITARPRLLDAVEKKGEHVPRFVIQIGEVTFRNQRDEVVARAISTMNRVPRVPSGGMKGYTPRLEQYSGGQLADLARARRVEVRRGAEPRYWEDVNVGDELLPIVKGPLRVVEIVIAASAGENEVNNFQGAHIYQIMHRRRHPADSYLDPETGVADHPHRGHWETYMSEAVGM
ncbi:MAG: MaoC family dehydratase N-terminal domain-containing protein, partial [Chloroflexota bacterium]|nr:MaoC family dehydratase N-terminal domain-containing protein [Chloroflexota bacterium]